MRFSLFAGLGTLRTRRRVSESTERVRRAVYAETLEIRRLLAADLAVSLSNTPNPVIAGNQLTYTLTLGNTGDAPASTVALTDNLPAGAKFVSATQTGTAISLNTPAIGATGAITGSAASYVAGGSTTVTVVCVIPSSAPDASTVSGTASVTTTSPEITTSNNSASTTSTVNARADLSVLATSTPQAVIGGQVVYSITVINIGPSDAQNVQLVTTPLPTGTSLVSLVQNSGPSLPGILPASSQATYTLTLGVAGTVVDATVLKETVSVTSATTDPATANNSAVVNVTAVTPADLVVTKTGPATAFAGNQVTYTITLNNTGSQDATNVTLSDLLPAGSTFISQAQTLGPAFTLANTAGTVTDSLAVLPGKTNTTFTVIARTNPSSLNGSTAVNTASGTMDQTDPTPANATATFSTAISTRADVQVTMTGPATATAGTDVTYSVTVKNAGPSDAQGVTLSDVLPANLTLVSQTQTSGPALPGTMPSSSIATFDIVAHLDSAAANASTVTNAATASTTTTDPTPANNTGSADVTVQTSADLTITESALPGPTYVEGANVTYQITFANNGPSDAKNAQITDVIVPNTSFISLTPVSGPAFSFTLPRVGDTASFSGTIASLPAGATSVFNVTVLAINFGTATNQSSVSSATTDPVSNNNAATSTVAVLDAPLTPYTQPPVYGIEGTALSSISVLTFTDGKPGLHPAEFAATINWGDGSQADASASISVDGAGNFYVLGTHTYIDDGSYTITATVSDAGGSSATATTTALIANAPLLGSAVNISRVEGTSFSGTVANFKNANPFETALSGYSATITWGDGSTSAGTIASDGAGGYNVLGTHTYTTFGSYATSIKVNELTDGGSKTFVGNAAISDAPLSAFGATINATEGTAVTSVPVAFFTDTNPAQVAVTPFSVLINWGDGTSSSGTVTKNTGAGFTARGSHNYLKAGPYTTSVKIISVGGSTVTVAGNAVVAEAKLTGTAATFTATHGVAFTNKLIGSFVDADPNNRDPANYNISINWGDGTAASAGTATYSATTKKWSVFGSHKYVNKSPTGGYKLKITVVDGFGKVAPYIQSVVINSVANVA